MQIILDVIKNNKKTIIKYLVIIVIISICKILLDYANLNKVFFSESYIYTLESTEEDYASELPYINVKGDKINELNNKLMEEYYNVIEIGKEQMTYEYYKSKRYLSLIIKMFDKDNIDLIPIETIVYNIDIKNKSIISDNELFVLFDTDINEISSILDNKIKEYYDYGIDNNYFDKSCNYECFKKENKVNLVDNNIYYIKNNYLMSYNTFLLNSEFVYDENIPFELYNFKIKER